jgi:transposase IS4-like protein
LRVQSAICAAVTTITTTITVAAGVFAPGHLGELTWQVPFELADAVLEETRARERRLRVLPSRVGIYFVLALGLFPALGYAGVWAKLTAALEGLALPSPPAKGLRDLRRRLGPAPLKALFEVLAGPVAQPSTPGVRFGRYRTVAFDIVPAAYRPRRGAWSRSAHVCRTLAGRRRCPRATSALAAVTSLVLGSPQVGSRGGGRRPAARYVLSRR